MTNDFPFTPGVACSLCPAGMVCEADLCVPGGKDVYLINPNWNIQSLSMPRSYKRSQQNLTTNLTNVWKINTFVWLNFKQHRQYLPEQYNWNNVILVVMIQSLQAQNLLGPEVAPGVSGVDNVPERVPAIEPPVVVPSVCIREYT